MSKGDVPLGPGGVHSLDTSHGHTPPLDTTVNKRVVGILLECFFVRCLFFTIHFTDWILVLKVNVNVHSHVKS